MGNAKDPQINTVSLSGRIAYDVEAKEAHSGGRYAKGAMYFNRGFGEKKKSYKVPLKFGDKNADRAVEHLRKGILVYIEGSFVINEWEGKDGGKCKEPEINVYRFSTLEWPDDAPGTDKRRGAPSGAVDVPDDGMLPASSDDIPF